VTKREPLQSQEYFDKWVAYDRAKIQEMQSKLPGLTSPLPNRSRYAYSIYHKVYELPILLYSAGAPIDEVRSAFSHVVDSWGTYEALADQAYPESEKPQRPTFVASQEMYVTALWILSLALVFEVDDQTFSRLVQLADGKGKGNNEGQDLLYEKLVSFRLPGRKPANKLLYPKPYKLLYDAFAAQGEDRTELFKQFLKQWYPDAKGAYWHDSHKSRTGEGFFGYWAIEAAGAAKAMKADDSSFREMPYYPGDLPTA